MIDCSVILCTYLEAVRGRVRRTSMRRHNLSRPTWRPSTWPSATAALCPSRYASIRTFGEPFGDSVHMMRSVLIGAKGAAIFRAVFLMKGGPSSHGAVALCWIRSAIRQQEPWPSATSLGSPSRCVVVSSPPVCSSVYSMASVLKPPPSVGADGRCRAGRRSPR
jgi:hypothetical protein